MCVIYVHRADKESFGCTSHPLGNNLCCYVVVVMNPESVVHLGAKDLWCHRWELPHFLWDWSIQWYSGAGEESGSCFLSLWQILILRELMNHEMTKIPQKTSLVLQGSSLLNIFFLLPQVANFLLVISQWCFSSSSFCNYDVCQCGVLLPVLAGSQSSISAHSSRKSMTILLSLL